MKRMKSVAVLLNFFQGLWGMNDEFLTQVTSIQLFCNFYVHLPV